MQTGRLAGIAWKLKPRGPMIEAERATVTIESGLAEDCRGKPGKRQITVLFASDWGAASAELGETRAWTIRRANLLVEGLTNPSRIGDQLIVGDVALEITGETEPCSNMDRQWPGLTAALTPHWRGGVTARVLTPGLVAVGDVVRLA